MIRWQQAQAAQLRMPMQLAGWVLPARPPVLAGVPTDVVEARERAQAQAQALSRAQVLASAQVTPHAVAWRQQGDGGGGGAGPPV